MKNPKDPAIQPHNEEVEQAFLGSLLVCESHKDMDDLIDRTEVDYFYSTGNQEIFRAIKTLRLECTTCDLIIVTDYLKDKGKLENVGGASCLSSLVNKAALPSMASRYLDILIRDYQKRMLLNLGLEISDKAQNGSEPDDIINTMQAKMDFIQQYSLRQPLLLSRLERWDYIHSLKIDVEWLVGRLIPKGSITVLFGKGGIGKTWLAMDMAKCIGSGTPFLGLTTIKTPVIYIDFENPLAVLNKRIQVLGNAEEVSFWRAGNEKVRPPKLDSKEWKLYKQLPKGSLLIFDTLRSSQGKDENASNEMGLIMGRLKELRDMGFTIILLHHTAKNSDKVAKGSTAIVDLADHILGLTLVKKKKDGQDVVVEDDEEDSEEAVYRFGMREKTRFEPYHVYLSLNPDKGFELAPDPQEDTLKEMHRILAEHGTVTKTAFKELCKILGLGEKKLRKMIEIGQGRYWDIEKRPDQRNAQFVTSKIQSGSLSPLYSGARLPDYPEIPENNSVRLNKAVSPKFRENIESGSLSERVCQTAKLDLLEGEI